MELKICGCDQPCVDCTNKGCWFYGEKEPNCPKYTCDRVGGKDCENCAFIDAYIENMRTRQKERNVFKGACSYCGGTLYLTTVYKVTTAGNKTGHTVKLKCDGCSFISTEFVEQLQDIPKAQELLLAKKKKKRRAGE